MTELTLIEQSVSVTRPERFSVRAEVVKERDAVLQVAREVVTVESPEEQASAAEVARVLQGKLKQARTDGLNLRRVLNETAQEIKSVEDDHCDEMEREKDRLGRLISVYQRKEKERVELEEKQRREEVARLDRERRALEIKAAACRDAGKAIQLEQRAYEAEQQAQELLRAAPVAAVKANGARTGRKLRYKVTDIHALYAARPDLCKVEEKPSAILAVCDPERPVPGLELWYEDKTTFVG